MVKRVLKWAGITVGGVFLIIIAAGIAAMIIVDKPFIETQMEKQLHRQVRIGDVSGSLFSAVSGFSVSDVRISNFKTEKAIEALKGKPVADKDVFASMKSFTFKISFPPLLKGEIVLKELMLFEPVINIVRYKNGAFNFSDLLVAKKLTPEEQAELEKRLKEEAEAAKKEPPSKPLKADDIPVAINVGSVGMQDGSINFYDQTSEQKINLYKVTAKVYDIMIDPKNLEKKDSIQLKVFTGIKTMSRPRSGSVESFDIGFDITGTVIPFDKKSRLLNPEITLKAGSPYGKITGLQVFNEMMNVEQLTKYCGRFDFLKKEVDWKNGYVYIHYKDNIATLKDGKIGNDDYALTFGGKVNVATMGLDLATDMVMAKKHTDTVKSRTQKGADKLITGQTRDYVTAEQVADEAVKPMLNEKGEIFIRYAVKGTAVKPAVKMIAPQLGLITDVVKKLAKNAAGKAVDKATDAAKDKAKEEAAKRTDEAKDKATSKIKKLF